VLPLRHEPNLGVELLPQQKAGVWNFPLAELRIAGSGRRRCRWTSISTSSSPKASPTRQQGALKKEMLDTYMQYFESNYFGIEARFTSVTTSPSGNGGAYWEAMQTFARKVCGLLRFSA
jgi:hypothetical protein